MDRSKFVGTGVALITPFDDENNIDVAALSKIVNYQIDNGIDYLVVLGTTAETATLTTHEKELVKETVINANKGRLPLVLGIGSNNTSSVVNEIESTDLSHFDAILSVSPYYNKPTQEGIYQHFKHIAMSTNKPIILYNVPGRTASNMSVETVVRLATDFSNIIGIKEAAGDLLKAYALIRETPDDFLVISGDDMMTLPMVLGGGSGVISVIGEGFPKAFSTLVNLALAGNSQEAFKIHHKIAPAIDMIFEQGNPAGIKCVFKHLGLSEEHVRLPLVKVDTDLQKRLGEFVHYF
jgi:4-hydroxy-tetrahydrodipicolinate synthase